MFMPLFLFVLSLLAIFVGATTPFFIIAAILFVGGAIVLAINDLKAKMTKELRNLTDKK